MREDKSNTLNIIRVIAMTGIVVDHYFQASGVPILANTGLQIGGVFLMVFFALSAYLFGMKWVKGDYEGFETMNFMKKRCLRIYIPLWLTLPMVVAAEYLILHSVDLKTILFNIVGLGWAKPFGIGGHLWYITLMMFLYVVFVVFSRLRLDKYRLTYWLVGYVALLAVYVLGESYFTTGSSVAPIITVFLASLLFFKSGELMNYCRRWVKTVLFVTIFALLLSWWMYVQGWHYTHKAIATFSSFSAGFCLFVCLMIYIKSTRSYRIISHFADISYEVYLVHLPLIPFTSDMLKMIGIENNLWWVIIPWLMLTYMFAIGIHKATQRITVDLNKK